MFRTGEVHGRVTPRAEEVCRLVAFADSAKVTSNLWGERWSKLVANAMQNGLSACTGLPGGEMLKNDPIRRFSTRLGSEAIRVGQALGYELEEILHLDPEIIARAGEGDEAAMQTADAQRFKDAARTASGQRPSMRQDMQKGRRTEIEFQRIDRARWRENRPTLPCQCGAGGSRQARREGRAQARSASHHRAKAELRKRAADFALQHFGLNKNNTAVDHVERACGTRRKIKHAAFPERPAIVDDDNDTAFCLRIGHAHMRAERQAAVGRGEALAVRWIEGTKS